MTYLFPQDLVLREPSLRLALVGYVTVIATRSTKPHPFSRPDLHEVHGRNRVEAGRLKVMDFYVIILYN
jgi:hypothetical protein